MGVGQGNEGVGMMMRPIGTNMGHDTSDGHGDGTMMHMTFSGKHTQVLFDGWPGDRSLGMFFVSLVFIATIIEAFSAIYGSRRGISYGALTVINGIWMGLAYMAMLAITSFNRGMLICWFLLSRSF
ncbi:copper transporter 6-like [Typha angustifolia]|uniref:copper transporter 6-like n=1 Tax=Typha angustifolia TaxID=59011 RepID=UPI003C2C84E5